MTSAPALPTTVIGGFLGAGKTTLVNHLLRTSGGRRLTVMVNDFGALPIDRDLILGQDGDTIALANGCACCSTGGDLLRALSRVLDGDRRPDHLVIEGSGVADPDRLADIARAEAEMTLSGVVVVVDGGRVREQCQDPRIGGQVRLQMAAADLLLINKCEGGGSPGLEAFLQPAAPRSAMIRTVRAAAPSDLVLGALAPRRLWRALEGRPHEDVFIRWAMIDVPELTWGALRALFDDWPPELLRLKGFVMIKGDGPKVLQAGPGFLELEPIAGILGGARVVAVGLPGLPTERLAAAFEGEGGFPPAQIGPVCSTNMAS
jgi:G3E family GTPase